MGTANSLLEMHKEHDVTVMDLVGNLGLNLLIGSAFSLGGDAAMEGLTAAIYATVTGESTSQVVGAVTEELRPKVDGIILWPKANRCPNGHSYTVNAAGKYVVYGSLPNLGCDYASWIYHLYARKD
jgi:hypothetical protein